MGLEAGAEAEVVVLLLEADVCQGQRSALGSHDGKIAEAVVKVLGIGPMIDLRDRLLVGLQPHL